VNEKHLRVGDAPFALAPNARGPHSKLSQQVWPWMSPAPASPWSSMLTDANRAKSSELHSGSVPAVLPPIESARTETFCGSTGRRSAIVRLRGFAQGSGRATGKRLHSCSEAHESPGLNADWDQRSAPT
jgi:hypothetical protein